MKNATGSEFDAWLKRLRKRDKKRKAKEQRAKVAGTKPKPKPKADPDRFYLCREWRALRYQVLKNTDGRCGCCGASALDGAQLHVDHIKPRSLFPKLALDIENLQVLCADCNIGKGAWDETDWRAHFRSI